MREKDFLSLPVVPVIRLVFECVNACTVIDLPCSKKELGKYV